MKIVDVAQQRVISPGEVRMLSWLPKIVQHWDGRAVMPKTVGGSWMVGSIQLTLTELPKQYFDAAV